MDRARRAGFALIGLLIMLLAVSASSPTSPGVVRAAAVSWPVSHDLVVAEVVTGGLSASDEWVEIANAGPAAVDLAGLELAYVTSSGSTVTRKATWASSRLLEPGRHLLVANVAGAYASIADATYSGGLAATGGVIVLRSVGGTPIDAVGWGDAANAFVEGTAAPAPPAGSSIERRPGGTGGNVVDTNDNAADWIVQPAPVPQPTSAPPVPGPSPSASVEPSASVSPIPSIEPGPSPEPSASPSPEPSTSPSPGPSTSPSPGPSQSAQPSAEPSLAPSPSPSVEASPSPEPSAEPSLEPSPSVEASQSPEPSASASLEPSPRPSPSVEPSPIPSPSVEPSAEPSASPGPEPTPSPLPPTDIASARALADGTAVTVEGVLTVDLGSIDSGRGGFVQDATGGIGIYLDASVEAPWPAGSLVVISGTTGSRYGQATLRAASSDVVALGPAPIPTPFDVPTGTAGEPMEGWRVRVSGAVVDAPSSLADGLGVTVDDGSGGVRVVVGPAALGDRRIQAGMRLTASGPLAQRDSSGTGTSGYRVMAMNAGDVEIEDATPSPTAAPSTSPEPSASAEPSPMPSVDPSPSPEPSYSPSPEPSASPGPSASPSPTRPPASTSIAAARLQPAGSSVVVSGVVTAEAGTLGKPPLLAVEDATAAIVVHLPEGTPKLMRGSHLLVRGRLASVYGQLEVRPAPDDVTLLGQEDLPEPLAVRATDLGEALEARLVTLVARVAAAPVRGSSGDLTVDVVDADGVHTRVGVDASRGIAREAFVRGRWYRFTGIEGQHASRLGALDGYRIWLRDANDLAAVAAPGPSQTPAPGPSSGPAASSDPTDPDTSSASPIVTILAAIRMPDVRLTVEGVVTVGTQLLDGSRRRFVLQDATAAVEILLASPGSVTVGERLRVVGTAGRAYGAPRIRAEEVAHLAGSQSATAAHLIGEPGESLEWRLVQLHGTVAKVTRAGESWRADVKVGGSVVLVVGLANAAIPAARVATGSDVTVTGIVRRPYPSATDRRFAVEPRTAGDLVIAQAGAAAPGRTSAATSGRGAGRDTPGDTAQDARPELVDLARLPDLVGRTVRVAGLLVDRTGDELWLDDGTARAGVVLGPRVAPDASRFRMGDAVEAQGTVASDADGAHLVVDDPAAILVAGSGLAATLSSGGSTAAGPNSSRSPSASARTAAGRSGSDSATVLGGMVAVGLLAAVVGGLVLRRYLGRRRSAALVGRRLAAIPAPSPRPLAVTFGDEGGHARSRTLHAG